MERNGLSVVWGNRSSADRSTALAGQLKVVEARQGPTAYAGSIYVMIEQAPEQMGGMSPLTGDPLAVWLGAWLAEPSQADNIRKLGRSGARERHIFVLVPGFTPAPFPVIDLLIEPGAPLPTIPPVLPPEITHAWAMSSWSTGDGFRWSPDNGWTRFAKVKP